MFCVYCGYPLKGEKKGFFAKSEETGVSRAEKLANDAPVPEAPAAKPAPAPAPAPMQNAQQIPQPNPAAPMNSVPPMGMPSPMGMPNGMAPMGTQPMMPGMPAQMGYGMAPQMGYGMPPQMQYGTGMPQFAGYDAAGNPMYVQMVPQLMGYDAYGNPIYNMVAMPYVMPPMQGMGMAPLIQQQPVYQQEAVIDVPQEQIRPADAVPAAKAAPAPAPVQKPAPAPSVPVQKAAPAPQPAAQKPPVQNTPVQKAVTQPAPAPAPVPVVNPIQSVQAATLAAMEALNAFQGVNTLPEAQPIAPSPFRSAEINSVYDMPMEASALINEDENAAQGKLPDEKAILDSIFGNKQKNYTMSAGTKPAAATFSINVGANEIRNVKEDEFGSGDQEAPPPAQSLFSKPGSQFVNPFVDPGFNEALVAASEAEAAVKPTPKKTSKPMSEKDANAAKRAAKEAKMREKEAAEAAKAAAEAAAKPAKDSKKKGQKKPPAKIVSPDEFFNDKPHNGTRSKSMLSVKDLDKLDDGQLEAHISNLGVKTGGKKSNRSMKAATKEEMDVSNIDVDALVGAGKSRLPN